MQRTLDPEVAAGNHNTVGKLDNIFQFDDRTRFFKLGNNQRPVADQRFCRPHIVGRLNKRKADPVHAHFQGKFQIAAIFFGNGGNRQFDVRQIDALVAGKLAADLNFRHRTYRVAGLDRQDDVAVVEQQLVARFDRGENFLVRRRHPRLVAGFFFHVEDKFAALFQNHAAVGKQTDAQLRPLQIGDDGGKQPFFFRQAADDVITLFVFFVGSVAEIETKGVGAGVKQGGNGLFVGGRRPDCGKNTRICLFWHFHPLSRFFIIAAL